ncbi:isochorismatase family protein [Roseovarius aestuariivivens]|uniref:isochorismatase family protein n=1 Tax=Roseovarius aestuariivivens TaxID=1888910 RepID=UPI0010801199|nr:isochorismatase family protein [Roseovarius aestuariivivens]
MEDAHVYEDQEFGHVIGPGRRIALLVVDFVNGFLDPALFGGGNISEAAARTGPVLQAARRAGAPVAFTRIVYAGNGADCGVWCEKAPRLRELTDDNPASHVIDALRPAPGELVLRKTQASGFFATPLAGWLTGQHVDTVLVTGCTTSGCVRATVVDAMSHNYRPLVVRDCVGDRALGPHEANLFDMEQKYADLVTAETAISLL